MTTKRKYDPLFKFLHSSKQALLTISFARLENILKDFLPDSARTTHAWWSNRKSGLQSEAWLKAGYRVIAIDFEKQQVTFQRLGAKYKPRHIRGNTIWDGTMIEALRCHMNLNQSQFAAELGVRQQTISEWERAVYRPTRAMSKFLTTIAERVKFPSK